MKCVLSFAVAATVISTAVKSEDGIEKVVVTGTRTPKLLASSPVKVDVIDGQAVARLSRGTLRQVLEVMPGVVVKRSAKDGYNIQLSGFNGDHVLVLLNGQPLLAPTGSAVDLDQISVSNIKQIEIVRGAASVLYGSAAMGGVINIITDTQPASHLKADWELARNTGNEVEGDEWGHLYRLEGAQNWDHWQATFNAQSIAQPGFDYNSDTINQNGAEVDKLFANGGLRYSEDGLVVSWKSRWFSEEKYKPVSVIPGQADIISYFSDVNQWQHDFRIEQPKNGSINARYITHDETSGNTNGLRNTSIQLAELEGQKVWMRDKVEWVGGWVVHQDKLDQIRIDSTIPEVDDASRNSVEAYGQGNWELHDNQYLAGVRVQRDSDFGWHHAIRASVSVPFRLANARWTWRAGVGESYRVPNLKERYYVFDHSNLGYMVLGNAELVPETAISGNMGLAVSWWTNKDSWQVNADINVHYSDADDFITTLTDAEASAESGLDIMQYQNLEQAILSGFDASVDMTSDTLSLQLNYSFLHALDGNDNRLPERPRHQLKASATWKLPRMSADWQLYGVYEGDVAPSESYTGVYEDTSFTLNTVFQQTLTPHWQWRLGAENLLDNHQNTAFSNAGLFDARSLSSRRIYAGVTYQFY
ncbi:TonB-dependent receptor plug domain-containing protein [Alteromonas pelagimontana]|uniref:TonB-dependent receptor plug domain-containing protein n=1 Tax=Alteromonas pelagimontana TaxID=1858656 RepID=UPI000A738DD9|nr:TonB-dependent receptor [Alteromonas pelagimontana]